MSNEFNASLTYLLSSTPYSLAYVLPLLCLSFVLTFAGTFLTLDRSRSFPPKTDYATLPGAFEKPKQRKFVWYFEGGIGGLVCGYTTGLHLTTFLSLLIPAKSASAPLSSKSFLAVWVLVCVFTTLIAGRYRYAALGMAGFSGGALASVALSVIIHPSLAPRVAITAIFTSLLTLLVFFFYFVPKFHSWLLHPTLRFCTSSNGAFGLVLSISLLTQPRIVAWANVWERLWVQNGDNWGTSKEKGLSAAFCAFLAVGIAVDWALRRWLGECPDEKWDNYLSNYMANLPNQTDRAGIFQPPKSFWDRFLAKSDKHDPILFPSDADLKATPQPSLKFGNISASSPTTPLGGFLKKGRTTQSNKHGLRKSNSRKRKPVKFGAVDDLSSSDEEESEDFKTFPLVAPPLSHSSSTPTLVDDPPKAPRKKFTTPTDTNDDDDDDDPIRKPLVIDYDAELAQLKKRKGVNLDGMPDYSDHEEEDVTSASQRRQSRDYKSWSPEFMKRHSSGQSLTAEAGGPSLTVPLPGAAPVPATPSLLKALDRIAIAHKDAFGAAGAPPPISMPVGGEGGSHAAVHWVPRTEGVAEEEEDNARAVEHARKERTPRWEEFWREVKSKAQT